MPSRAACRRMACFTSSRTPLSAPRVAIRRSKIIMIILIYLTSVRYEHIEKKNILCKTPAPAVMSNDIPPPCSVHKYVNSSKISTHIIYVWKNG